MTRFGGLGPVSRPAVALASASTCAVVGAAAVGATGPLVVVGGVCCAAAGAVLSARDVARRNRSERPLLSPLAMGGTTSGVTIIAPRACDLADAESVHSPA